MAETTWAIDAPSGVYKNHALSGRLLIAAAKGMKCVQFTTKEPGFGKRKGETVTIPYYKALDTPTSAVLDADTRIPIDKLQMGTRAITVSEWGRGVEVDNLFVMLSAYDPLEKAQKLLIRQMNEVMDNAAADAFKAAKVCFIPTSLTGGTWDTDGTASTTALANLTLAHVELIRDYMSNDLHVPFYNGDTYAALMATKALRGIKNDRRFERWHQYLRKGDLIYRSEVGQAEQVRFVEVTNTGAFSNGVGTGSVLGEGAIFGDEAVSRVEVEFPELRAQPNYQGDFGRRHAVAWYGVVAFGVTWDTANDGEAKVIRICSA